MRMAICFSVALLACPGLPGKSSSASPNVLLITLDAVRADHLSCYGYPWKTSPNIDELAREGTRFDRAYTVIPLTGPAHLSLFTSRYPQEHGARRNGLAIAGERTYVALPQLLRAHGYRSGGFISGWPLNGRLTHINEWFDDYDEELTRKYQLFNSSRWAEDVTPRAIEWLKQTAATGKPFFLWVHYFDPHAPYEYREHFSQLRPNGGGAQAHPADGETQERIRNYDTEIAYTDWHLGKLLGALRQLGVEDSTLVVLTADHGESLGEHDYVGHGRHLFENIIRVPLIVRQPGSVKAGQVVATPVSLLDIAPTVVDLTVRRAVDSKKTPLTFAGKTLAPALTKGDKLSGRRLYYVTFPGKKGFAPGWLSRLWVGNEALPSRFGYLDGARKLVWSPEDEWLGVYDVARDPGELQPRIEKGGRSAVYRTETSHLESWFSRTESRASEQQLSKQDVEVLKSLGYVQ